MGDTINELDYTKEQVELIQVPQQLQVRTYISISVLN